jgi:hypothetical protein
MSAYLCSNKHISAIVRAAIPGSAHNKLAVRHEGKRHELSRAELGNLLYDENVRSLHARYRDGAKEMIGDGGYRYEDVNRPNPLDALKLCNGYSYQACESDDWDRTLAHAAIGTIKESLVRALPGYDEAPWGL